MFPCLAVGNILHNGISQTNVTGNVADSFARSKTASNDSYLTFIGFGRMILFSERTYTYRLSRHAVSVFSNHILRIIFCRAQKQMGWIDTQRSITLMEYPKTFGNFPIVKLPTQAMRAKSLLENLSLPIAGRVASSLPQPTFVNCARRDVFPKGRFWRVSYATVRRKIAHGLTSDIAVFGVGLGRKICFLTAAAHTQTAWIWARSRKGKLGLGKLWSMLCHVISSFQLVTKPGALVRRRLVFYLVPLV